MTHSDQVDQLAAALSKAQGEIQNVVKDAKNPAERESEVLYRFFRRSPGAGRGEEKRPIHERLINRVVFGMTTCWHFCGPRTKFGYGRITVRNRMTMVHRLSYEAFVGPIPDGMFVLHRCDNRACINPEHLWIGTQGDNMRDCHAKGRANLQVGDKHWTRRRR